MPTAGFRRYGRFEAMQADVRASGLRVGCSPLGTTPGGGRRREGSQFLLANQNLQDLVLKCLLRTKDSRVANTWQALFDAQEGPPETTTKTAHCGSVCRIFTHVPPPIHRLVHSIASRRTVGRTLQFCDNAQRRLASGPSIRGKCAAINRIWDLRRRFHTVAACRESPAATCHAATAVREGRSSAGAPELRRIAESRNGSRRAPRYWLAQTGRVTLMPSGPIGCRRRQRSG